VNIDQSALPGDPRPTSVRPPDIGGLAGRAEHGVGPVEPGALHRLLVESVSDYAIFALDLDGNVLSWSGGAEQVQGYAREEVIGRHFSTFYPSDQVEAGSPERDLEIARREGRAEAEGWRVRADGSRFWANVVVTALRDTDGTLIGFAAVARDLSERRQTEERLRESEQRFRILVEGVHDYAIFMLGTDGTVVSWNDGARRIKGWLDEEIIGRHFSAFYPEPDVRSGKPGRALKIAATDGTYEEEGIRVRKDGTSFWASVLITALHDPDGKPIGFAKVTRDLTERRAAEERALADARRIADAEASSRTKSEFLAAMSHELRTPINATLGYVELLELGIGGEDPERVSGYLRRIRESQQHLLQIISDLLNYSRIEAGRIEYELTAVPVDPLVESVLPMVEPQANAKRIILDHEPCVEGPVAHTDLVRTGQIVLNLLGNAVKFTPEGGRVAVRCACTDARVTVSVSDTGPGIPEDQQRSIFEPFVQLGRSLSSGHEGTGLGLAISRDLARAMGGELSVQSSPGEGAVFTLALPRAQPAPRETD
jgi:PAS domain S-box-containing protein